MSSDSNGLLLALEGGGTRSQAALLNFDGQVLQTHNSSAVNTNFVSLEQAQRAVVAAVEGVLQAAGARGSYIRCFVTSLLGAHFG
jgi:N-acetylglucosamine kinase-like BadF-type ATPase